MESSSGKPNSNWRYKYFGYLISREWLLEYGVDNSLCPDLDSDTDEDVDEIGSIISAAVIDILAKSKLLFASKIGTVMSYDDYPEYCIAIATNHPQDNLPVPSPDKYSRLKELLETSEEPKWYYAAS